jgi:hypothetical protein
MDELPLKLRRIQVNLKRDEREANGPHGPSDPATLLAITSAVLPARGTGTRVRRCRAAANGHRSRQQTAQLVVVAARCVFSGA